MSQSEKPHSSAPALPTPIELPSEAIEDLKRIAGIEENTFASLLKAIVETKPSFTVPQFARKVLQKVPGIAELDLRSTLIATVSLHSMLTRAGGPASIGRLLAGILSAETLTPEQKTVLESRLPKLLTADGTLEITAKAREVMTEHEHIFCNVRMLSDIRPVFSDDLEKSYGAVIIHNLRIGYHQDQKHRDFYVALDTDDIRALKVAIERAEKKTLALEAILKQSNVSYLEV
jgi:hypothetical protein